MLAELFLTLATPAGAAARRRGHLAAAVGLWRRAGRCKDAWAPHEAACHAAVRAALARLPAGGTVVVLGSGLVLDVPLADLQARFDRVLLVDAVHLLPVRLEALAWRRTRLVTADLDAPPGGDLGAWLAGFRPALVISANVLSQIPLARDVADPPAAVARHLAGLAAAGCPALLLTDTDERRLDRSGRVIETLDLLHGVALPPPDSAWDWLLAPYGDVAADVCLVHAAGAWWLPAAPDAADRCDAPRSDAAHSGMAAAADPPAR
jgi:hypothetical protein